MFAQIVYILVYKQEKQDFRSVSVVIVKLVFKIEN